MKKTEFVDFRVEREFPKIGRKTFLLSAGRSPLGTSSPG